jgi:GT2 family glycosyltransferase
LGYLVDIRLFVVVLHYGDPALTRRVVHELESGAREGTLVHVLDNAAPLPYEGSGAIRRLPENLFWAGGFAAALDWARKEEATHLWFCNNDIRFTSDPPHAARLIARMERMAGKLGRLPGVYAPAVTRNPYHPQMVRREGVAFSRVSCVDGIAPVVALDCVEALGGPDAMDALDAADNPRGYGVDVWLSLRASRAGWPVVVDHGLVVRHEYHTTARSVPGFMTEAAQDEDKYLAARLGPDWRERLKTLQDWQDEASL